MSTELLTPQAPATENLDGAEARYRAEVLAGRTPDGELCFRANRLPQDGQKDADTFRKRTQWGEDRVKARELEPELERLKAKLERNISTIPLTEVATVGELGELLDQLNVGNNPNRVSSLRMEYHDLRSRHSGLASAENNLIATASIKLTAEMKSAHHRQSGYAKKINELRKDLVVTGRVAAYQEQIGRINRGKPAEGDVKKSETPFQARQRCQKVVNELQSRERRQGIEREIRHIEGLHKACDTDLARIVDEMHQPENMAFVGDR